MIYGKLKNGGPFQKYPDCNSSPFSPWFLREGNLERLPLPSQLPHIHFWKEIYSVLGYPRYTGRKHDSLISG